MQSSIKRILLIVVIFLMTAPFAVSAATIRNDANLAQNENIPGNVYLTGSAPVMAGNVQGDLVASGGTIVVTGNVSQDGLIAGGNINISGNFGGDVRIFGGNIYFDGTAKGELITAGGNVRIGPNAVINGDTMLYGGKIEIDPAAKILGKKTIQSGDQMFDEEHGGTARLTGILQTAFLVSQLITIISLLIVAALLFGFCPKFTNVLIIKSLEKSSFWKNLGIGLLMFFMLPIAAALCLISGIGWILGLLLIFAFIIYLLVTMVLSGVIFGGWLYGVTKKPKKFQMKWWALITGVILLHVISLIPLIGWIVAYIFMLVSWGATARLKLDLIKSIK